MAAPLAMQCFHIILNVAELVVGFFYAYFPAMEPELGIINGWRANRVVTQKNHQKSPFHFTQSLYMSFCFMECRSIFAGFPVNPSRSPAFEQACATDSPDVK